MSKKTRIKLNCQKCGNPIERTPYFLNKNKLHFCSNECHYEYRNSLKKERQSKTRQKKVNPYTINNDHALISIKNNILGSFEAIIDLVDVEICKQYFWNVRANKKLIYVEAREGSTRVHLHRLINNTPEGLVTDHINGNTLDNRRSNLRGVSQQENCLNRHCANSNTKHRGIHKNRSSSFVCKIGNVYLGSFKTLDEALLVRKEALKNYA